MPSTKDRSSQAYAFLVSLFAAWAAPALLNLVSLEPLSGVVAYRNSVFAALGATLIAAIGQYRVSSFPGVSSFASLFSTYALGFGLVILAFLGTRLPYSNVFLGVSFAAALGSSLVFEIRRARRRQQLYLVPGGRVGAVSAVGNVDVIPISEPILPAQRQVTIVADLHHDHPAEWEAMLAQAALQGVPVFHFKTVLQNLTGRVQIDHLSENIYGSLMPNLGYLGVKRILDTIGVIVLLPILIPLLLVVSIMVRIDSPGPALFRQMRIGYRGETFKLYKFRTMRSTSPVEVADARLASMTRDNDERITRLGRFLRRSRIDELPQVINILRGEMSWIGPRPEAVELADWYQNEVPFYAYRHIVRPGITGWAQVNQGHVTDIVDIKNKLQYDFFYIANFSYWLDALIVARSALVVFNGYGAR